jgi:hypothetical protein
MKLTRRRTIFGKNLVVWFAKYRGLVCQNIVALFAKILCGDSRPRLSLERSESSSLVHRKLGSPQTDHHQRLCSTAQEPARRDSIRVPN